MNSSCNESFPLAEILSLMLYDLDQLFSKTFVKTFGRNCKKILSKCRHDSVEQFCFKKFLYFNFFLTFSGKFFDPPKKCACQNCNLLDPMKMFLDFFLWKNNSINTLRLRSKSHRIFEGIFCAWLSELHSKSLEEPCDDDCFW